MYADDGELYTYDTGPVSLERRISREVSLANAGYEINGMIAIQQTPRDDIRKN